MICPRCASANNPSEKFCTVCSSPLAQPGGFPPPQQGGFGPPPQQPQAGYGYGPPPQYDPNQYGPPPGGMQGPNNMMPPNQGMDYNQQFPNQFPPQPFPPPDPYNQSPGYGSPGGADPFSATNFQQPAQPPTNAMTPFPPQPAVAPPPPPPPPQPAGGEARPAAATGSGKRRPLAGFLVSFQDDTNGRFWPIYQGRNLIGRAETGQEVDVPIGHGTTSTNHATLEAENGRLVLSDLGSTNGTFHNEEAIGFQGRRELRDGDKVRFGGFSVIVINVAARA